MPALDRLIRIVGICLLLLAPLAPARAQSAEPPLLFLGNAAIAPMVFQRGQQTSGVAVELAQAALAKAGLNARIEATDWDVAQRRVAEGTADALVHINPNPEREAIYDFSAPLVESHFHIFRLAGRHDLQDLKSLAGQRVGVERAGFPLAFLKRHPEIRAVVIPDWATGFAKVRAGELDAVFVDRWVGEYESYLLRLDDVTLVDPPIVSEWSRIAVRKGNRALLEKIDAGLREIERDGTRQAILERWRAKEVVHLTREELDLRTRKAIGSVAALLIVIAAGALGYAQSMRRSKRLVESALAERSAALASAQAAHAALQSALAESEDLYQNAPCGYHSIGPDGTLLKINDTELGWLGVARADVVGRPVSELLTDESREVMARHFPVFRREGHFTNLRIDMRRRDGSRLPLLMSATAVRDENGHFLMSRTSCVDVTSLLHLQLQLDEAQRVGHVGSWSVDLEHDTLSWSAEMCRLYGFPENAPPDRHTCHATVAPEDTARLDAAFADLVGHAAPLDVTHRVTVAGVNDRWVRVVGAVRQDSCGRIVGVNGTAQDVTDQFLRAREMQDQLSALRAIVEAAPVPMVAVDAGGAVRLMNSSFTRTFGYRQDDVPTRERWFELAHPDPLERQAHLDNRASMLRAAETTGQPTDPFEVTIRCRDGTTRSAVVTAAVVGAGGEAIQLATMFDITERKALERDLVRALAEKSALLDQESVGVVTTRHRTIVWCNPAFESMLGYGPGEAVGRPTRDFFASADAWASFGCEAYPRIEAQGRFAGRSHLVRRDGDTVWVDFNGKALSSDPSETLWCLVDVTARKRAEDELARYRDHLEQMVEQRTNALRIARDLAESANRAKSAFLSNMSHELRTPLNHIVGMTDIAKRRSTDESVTGPLEHVEHAASTLLGLISEVIDYSRVESDRVSLAREPFVLQDVVERQVAIVRTAAQSRQLALSIDIPPDVGRAAYVGDALRLGQVLLNLVDNAVKFTSQGAISVSAQRVRSDAHHDVVRFEIADTGIGVSKDDRLRIFQPFEQADNSPSRQYGGTGLGLAICSRLVRLMGGTLGVDSVPGEGATFWFTIPIETKVRADQE